MGTFSGETQNSDHKCSSKKMEVDEGLNLNTVACLRGRLLAERHASKVAKEKAESMANKLDELEKLVKEEIKLRDKSERKLKFLRKKLESLSKSRQLGHSDSSQNCENSCGSSSISSNSKYSEAKNQSLTENLVLNGNISETQKNSSFTTKDWDSQITHNNSSSNYSENDYSSQKILIQNPNSSSESEDLKDGESRISNLSIKSCVTENESYADSFDNSLALVPVNMTSTSQATKSNQKSVNQSVFEALDALRVAKEKLQNSLETRQMIRVGPI